MSARRARGRAAPLWWVAAGLLVLAALVWGVTDPGDSLVVHDLLDHPVLLGMLGYALLAWGVRTAVRDAHRRFVATILLSAVGAASFGLVGLVISEGVRPGRDEIVLPAPPANGAAGYEADVVTDGDEVSPLITVVVRHRSWSWSARRHEVACLNADRADAALDSARWEGPTRLVVRLRSGRQVPIDIDPATAGTPHVVREGRRCGVIPPD